MTNFQHLQEPSLSVSTLKSVLQHVDPATQQPHATDPLGMMSHAILDTLHMEEKTHVVDTNHQVGTYVPIYHIFCFLLKRLCREICLFFIQERRSVPLEGPKKTSPGSQSEGDQIGQNIYP